MSALCYRADLRAGAIHCVRSHSLVCFHISAKRGAARPRRLLVSAHGSAFLRRARQVHAVVVMVRLLDDDLSMVVVALLDDDLGVMVMMMVLRELDADAALQHAGVIGREQRRCIAHRSQ